MREPARFDQVPPEPPAASPAREHLVRLFAARNIVLACLALTAIGLTAFTAAALPLPWIAAALVMLGLANVVAHRRLAAAAPVPSRELMAHLLADLGILTFGLYAVGGVHSPFATLYFLPVTIAAVALPRVQALAVSAAAGAGLALVALVHAPRPELPHLVDLIGPLLTLACLFHVAMSVADTNRSHARRVAQARELEMNDQHMLDLGSMAAGAAHELSTPLSTMAVLVADLRDEAGASPDARDSLALLARQIDSCRASISRLANAAGHMRAEGGSGGRLDGFLTRVVDSYQVVRAGVHVDYAVQGINGPPEVVEDQALRQAILAMLDVAGSVSPDNVRFDASWDKEWLEVTVRDFGGPVAEDAGEHFGEPDFAEKAPGRGLGFGLHLARSTVQRFGGTLSFSNSGDGASSRMRLPVTAIRL